MSTASPTTSPADSRPIRTVPLGPHAERILAKAKAAGYLAPPYDSPIALAFRTDRLAEGAPFVRLEAEDHLNRDSVRLVATLPRPLSAGAAGMLRHALWAVTRQGGTITVRGTHVAAWPLAPGDIPDLIKQISELVEGDRPADAPREPSAPELPTGTIISRPPVGSPAPRADARHPVPPRPSAPGGRHDDVMARAEVDGFLTATSRAADGLINWYRSVCTAAGRATILVTPIGDSGKCRLSILPTWSFSHETLIQIERLLDPLVPRGSAWAGLSVRGNKIEAFPISLGELHRVSKEIHSTGLPGGFG
jgi:hypothetical protein